MIHPTEETLLQYRFDTLEPTEGADVADHLRTCADCAQRFAAIGVSLQKLEAYDADDELNPGLVARAVETVKEEAPAPERRPRRAVKVAPPRLLAWFGFLPGASFRDARRAASFALVASTLVVFGGKVLVDARGVRTNTVFSAEQILRPGARSYASVAVKDGSSGGGIPGARVTVTLLDEKRRIPVFDGETAANGVADVPLDVPENMSGNATLEVTSSARGEEDVIRRPVTIARDLKVHLSTDKPLYQPGQTIHVRALALSSPSLVPAKDEPLVFEVLDPNGNRLATKSMATSAFGIAAWDAELASELPLGDYRVRVAISAQDVELAVKVARYTLPRLKVDVRNTAGTLLAGDTLHAQVNVKYFFGKPAAQARLQGVLTREDGSVIGDPRDAVTDKAGNAVLDFALSTALGMPGKPEAVKLQLEVTDAAGQREQKAQTFLVARELLSVEVFADQGGLTAGLPNSLFVLTTTPEGVPVPCDVKLQPESGPDVSVRTDANGLAVVTLPQLPTSGRYDVEASSADGRRVSRRHTIGRSDNRLRVDTDRALYRPGEVVQTQVTSLDEAGGGTLRVYKDGRVVLSQPLAVTAHRGEAAVALPPGLTGTFELVVGLPAGPEVSRRFIVADPGGLSISMTADAESHRPGETGKLRFQVKDASGKPKVAALGVSVVDESLWSMTASRPALTRAFFLLDKKVQTVTMPVAAADLLALREITPAAQLAAKALLVGAGPEERAAVFNAETLADEQDKLAAQQRTWNRFFDVGWKGVLAAFMLLALLLMFRDGTGLLVPLAIIVSWVPAMMLFDRHIGEVTLAWLVLYVGSLIGHSLKQRQMMWGYVLIPILAIAPITIFGDNIRRLFSMSADSLAVNDTAFAMMRMASPERTKGAVPDEGQVAVDPPADSPPSRNVRVRQHFPETLYVQPELITDEAGVATLELPFADSITDWRLSVLASSMQGDLGSMDAPLRVFQDFFVDVETPVALVRGDSASIAISAHNYLASAQTVRLEVKEEDWFELVGPKTFALELASGAVGGHEVRLKVLKTGRHTLTVKADGTSQSDAVARPLLVTEAGQLKTISVSGTLNPKSPSRVALTLPTSAGAATLRLKIFPSPLASALDGLEGLLKTPSGCFEQTSSTTYPNVLIWDYLQKSGKKKVEAEKQAQRLVGLGYQRLLTFEVKGGGFEWFGRDPANQVLTAYGLMEFADMARVYPVDEKLIARTQAWLIDRQQANGAWLPDQQSLSDGLWKAGFDGRLMVTAYIAWSLLESGYRGPQVDRALAFLDQQAGDVTDGYTLALLTATFAKAKHPSTPAVVKRLTEITKHEKDLAWVEPSQKTLYYSRGAGANIEATALAAYALMVAAQEPKLVDGLLAYVAANRDPSGAWHSTQGTVLALRALLYAAHGQTSDGELTVTANGQAMAPMKVLASADHPSFTDLPVKPGVNLVEVASTGTLQFQVIAVYSQAWREKPSPADAPLSLRVLLGRTKVTEGSIVPVELQATYRGEEPSGMVVVTLGVPAGLAPLQEDLKALLDAKTVAKIESSPGRVDFYLDRLKTNAPQRLSVRLRAVSKVDTQGVGSEVFLYYQPEVRAAAAAVPVQVN